MKTTKPDDTIESVVDAVLEATRASPRQQRLLDLARFVSVILGALQIVIAMPDLLRAPGHMVHSSRHVGAFAIAIGVGLIYAGLYPHRASGLVPPLLALSAALAITCAVDIIHGRWPSELSVHLISPVSAGILWGVAHAVRPRDPASGQRRGPRSLS